MSSLKIKNIFVGSSKKVIDNKKKEYESSYKKEAILEDVYVSKLGLKGDTQTDKEHHGGVDKAVCVYPSKNYDYLKQEHNLKLPLCAFGENITLDNIGDDEVCLGDIYSCGEVLLEVTQPRQPCWKISSILGIKNLTALVLKEYKTGFYLRVLKEGNLNKDCTFNLEKREYKDISIEFINKACFNKEEENIKKILKCSQLSSAYRATLEKKLASKKATLESWQEDL